MGVGQEPESSREGPLTTIRQRPDKTSIYTIRFRLQSSRLAGCPCAFACDFILLDSLGRNFLASHKRAATLTPSGVRTRSAEAESGGQLFVETLEFVFGIEVDFNRAANPPANDAHARAKRELELILGRTRVHVDAFRRAW